MVYVLIGVVLLVIIVPIIGVLPSARQKEQMALRRKAMAEGLSVELTRIEDPDPDPEKYRSVTGKALEPAMSVTAYRILRPTPRNWRQAPRVDWAVVRRAGAPGGELPPGWTWENELSKDMSNELKSFIANGLQKMPNDVVRVDEVRRVISVYWNERDGEDALNEVIHFLKECAGIVPANDPEDTDDRSE